MPMREKYNLTQELKQRNKDLTGKKRLALVGQGSFSGANNLMRLNMNNKHQNQHLTIDNPEFPFFFDGKENITGEYSSFYTKTDKEYEVVSICKKYEELLKGKPHTALYFLHAKSDDSYILVERKEVEDLTENFGFSYKNDYIDACEVGDIIPPNTMLTSSTSYDEYGNASVGINGRIINAVHPVVQDDAIICSKSFAKRAVINNVTTKKIPIGQNTILLNRYGKGKDYQGLPDIGDHIENGIICATRGVKEARMFSDLRDASLNHINLSTDNVFYGNGEVIDINVYCNNPNMKTNKVNKQLIQYYIDCKWFYTKVYKACKAIVNSGSENIDPEIHRWMRLAINYLDTNAYWAFNNDNVFSEMMVEILLRKKEDIKVGRKIVGRYGNKTVVCSVWPDEWMPYLTTEIETDQYGIVHPKGVVERVDLITNPIAFINRTIPLVMIEGSVTFILDRIRKYCAGMEEYEEAKEIIFDIVRIFNKKEADDFEVIYNGLSDKKKKEFILDCISVDDNGLLMTNNGIYIRWEAFNEKQSMRDAIIKIYEKYGNIIQPYHIFVPKPKWGRDIYIGQDCIGYQYMMVLKQSGEKGFSVRSAGSISDESLPEKSHDNKIGRLWHSEKPIRFGEYESPNFLIITNPEDFALVTALYRTSIDGRKWMYEAILSDSGKYNIPDDFTSRSVEILQVYLKSLGVRMSTVTDETNFIGEPEDNENVVGYQVGNATIFCTPDEMYYLGKLGKVYKRYLKENPNTIDDEDEVWDYIMENLPFKKKDLTDNIIDTFKHNMEAFANMK